MTPEQAREKLSALVDGTLSPIEEREVKAMLAGDENLRREYEQLLALRRHLRQELPPPAVSDQEWDQVALAALSRHAQRFGWVLLTPGALALLVGAFVVFFTDPSVPLWTRLAMGGLTAGVVFLLLAAIADRLRARRLERYDKVQR